MDLAPRSRLALMVLVVTAVPSAWGLETALRTAFFPADFEELRMLLSASMTTVARAMLVLTAALLAPSYFLMRRLARARLRALPALRPELRASARVLAFLGASSLLQLPGVVVTFSFMFGAALRPVAASVGLGTAGLLVLAALTLRDAAREGAHEPPKNP
ncbi:MAG: hypothetical protein H6725_12380 [Sandaracinaceae bacterium]|nr:hypothetical protein [Sandaracinaceae bacterium]